MLTCRVWMVLGLLTWITGCGASTCNIPARDETPVPLAIPESGFGPNSSDRRLSTPQAHATPAQPPVAPAVAEPPVANVLPQKVNLGGRTVVDNYWWLRDKSDPAVITYLNEENNYTDAVMKPTLPLQEKLLKEMSDRLPNEDESVPYRDGNWWYSSRRDEEYPIYLRRQGSPTAKPDVIANVNDLVRGHKFFDYIQGPVSNDGNYLLFATDVTGNRQYVLQVKDLRSGKVLHDSITVADAFEWMADNKTFYYTKEDDAKRAYRLYRHVIGTPVAGDPVIYEEKDEQFALNLLKTRDRKFLILSSESKTATEARALSADRITGAILIAPRQVNRQYYLDHRNDRFYIRVNDNNGDFRIVTAPDSDPTPKNWRELVPAHPDVIVDDLDVFAHHLVLSERRGGITQLAVTRLPDGAGDPALPGKLTPKEVPFNEPDFTVTLGDNFEFDPPALRITYTSLTTPMRIIDMNLDDGTQTLKKQDQVESYFDASNYHEERLFATAKDGTKIPISLVYRLARGPGSSMPGRPAGPHPLLMDGYGSYGNSEDVYFSSSRLSLLDRGVIFAIAHVRGGGEFGRKWYDGGRVQRKPNTFGDFIAAAEFLEKNGYTAPDRLAIYGASAGGLLIGAVVNQRPDLFRAAIAEVPWVDVLADMSDPSIPLTTLEYTEWGNPNNPAERAMIASYDPYTNVHAQAYPAMLVRESLNDSQVQYWDAARWVAKLRAAKRQAGAAGRSELLFKMDMDAGHDGASGQEAALHDDAFDDAWILTRLGVEK